jgi:hypothetical protein
MSNYYNDYFSEGKITTSPLYKDSLDYELKIYNNNQLIQHYFPYNRVREPRFKFTEENVGIIRTDTPFIRFVVRPFCDTIYKLVKDSLFPAYQIVMPLENTLPPSFFTKPFKNKTERDNFYQNNGWMMQQVSSFYETPKFIFLRVGYLSNYDSYLYEKQTNVTYKTKNIKGDSSVYNLQLIGDVWRNSNRYYKLQRVSDLLPFFDQNKNIPIPKELEAFLKSNPPGTTPIIVEYKFKN